MADQERALIVGVGEGLSASLTQPIDGRRLSESGSSKSPSRLAAMTSTESSPRKGDRCTWVQ